VNFCKQDETIRTASLGNNTRQFMLNTTCRVSPIIPRQTKFVVFEKFARADLSQIYYTREKSYDYFIVNNLYANI